MLKEEFLAYVNEHGIGRMVCGSKIILQSLYACNVFAISVAIIHADLWSFDTET